LQKWKLPTPAAAAAAAASETIGVLPVQLHSGYHRQDRLTITCNAVQQLDSNVSKQRIAVLSLQAEVDWFVVQLGG
jgi:hypothetical protein